MNRFKHNRHSIRLKDYDYSQENYYFVTICSKNRECLFGEIMGGEMKLNKLGEIIYNEWQGIPKRYQNVWLDEFIVMPNHLHGIIKIVDLYFTNNNVETACAVAPNGAGASPAPTLGNIIGSFKSLCFHYYKKDIWQRNYFEHIIRNEKSLEKIRKYIISNSGNWQKDINHPNNFWGKKKIRI